MKNTFILLVGMLLAGQAFATSGTKINIPNIKIRPGVSTNITIDIYSDGSAKCSKNKAFALHGMAHTGTTWKNLAQTMFADRKIKTCRLYAINFPGRGGSGLPSGGVILSELGLNDYATIALNVLEYFKDHNILFDSIIGHSAGTIEIELMQNRLINNYNTDLKKRYGIKNAILIAPSGTATQLTPDNGSLGGLLDAFTFTIPTVGPAITVPDYLFTGFFFTNLAGSMDPLAPSTADVTANAYNSLESVKFAKEVVWAAPEAAPSVSANIFKGGKTRATVIGGNNDIYVPAALAEAEYRHITGDNHLHGLKMINDEFAVHDLLISRPQWIINRLPAGF